MSYPRNLDSESTTDEYPDEVLIPHYEHTKEDDAEPDSDTVS